MLRQEQIKAEAHGEQEYMRRCRRQIHSNPELSFEEHDTARFIARELEEAGISFRPIAGTGILARIDGGAGDVKRAVVLRADIDALPIEEKNEHDFASKRCGVMHACGHDMHAAVLLGALRIINKYKKHLKGTVFGIFQPGEELCPGGAVGVIAERPFDGYDVLAVIGEHVEPEMHVGTFGFKAGQYMASSDEVRIDVIGQGGHAALTHRLKDPVVAAAALIGSLQTVVSRNADSRIPTVLSFGRVIADGMTNVIPDRVHLEGTFRTFDEEWRAEAKRRIREISDGTAKAYGMVAEVNITDGYPCVVNDERLTGRGVVLAEELFGDGTVEMLDLRPTAEDFGSYTKLWPSLFYRIGVGNPALKSGALHTSTFNPDDDALEYGAAMFVAMTVDQLNGAM